METTDKDKKISETYNFEFQDFFFIVVLINACFTVYNSHNRSK